MAADGPTDKELVCIPTLVLQSHPHASTQCAGWEPNFGPLYRGFESAGPLDRDMYAVRSSWMQKKSSYSISWIPRLGFRQMLGTSTVQRYAVDRIAHNVTTPLGPLACVSPATGDRSAWSARPGSLAGSSWPSGFVAAYPYPYTCNYRVVTDLPI